MKRYFWWITLAALLAMAVTASLGVWQLGRASQKEVLRAQREARQAMTALDWPQTRQGLLADEGQTRELIDRQVKVVGHWVAEATVFLDNRQMNGRSGFYVVTPLRLEGMDRTVLIQRGWVPRRFDDRTAVPNIEHPTGLVALQGRLTHPPSKLYEFDGREAGAIRQNIDLGSFGAEWSLALLPFSVLQTEAVNAADADLLRDWPLVGSDVYKHYGYAFQWFGLCTLIAVLYVWFQFIAPKRRGRAPAA